MAIGDRLLLHVHEVSVIFWRRQGPVRALAEVTLEVRPGECVALIGSSGSGKSLLARVAAGELPPSAGAVFFDGLNVYERRREFRAQVKLCRLGYLPECPGVARGGDLMAHILRGLPSRIQVLAQERAERFLEELELAGKIHWSPQELSSGERQRLELVRALAPKPDLLVLDNPTAHVDDHFIGKISEILRDFNLRGGAIFLVSNEPRLRKLAGRVYRLEGGVLSPV